MGAGQSTSQSHAPSRALHVLRVTPSSPASHTTIEPFFDFVVGFEGDSLSAQNIDVAELERIVESHEGRTLNLLVWNSKSQETRGTLIFHLVLAVVPIVPSRAWSLPQFQPESSQIQPSLLGLSMRICEPEFALDNVWHVLDVLEGSPAESAGLVPYGDYITGWSGGVLGAENDFYDLVEAHVDKPLRVYVYSHDFDALREVVLVPNRHWGGDGLLGCVFGYGLLHRIPPHSSGHVATTPPEIEEDYEDQSLFVPADVQSDTTYMSNQHMGWGEPRQAQWRQDPFPTQSSQDHIPKSIPTILEESSPEFLSDMPHQHSSPTLSSPSTQVSTSPGHARREVPRPSLGNLINGDSPSK
ncbi:golgi reassembly stacking protein 2 [Armillaria novae-zelandiae]|uniref:Golgi reassembly stacking protein 2 n=1 Tax=Armillaria novae-zelandiae TaxID=153914 RepID=A0AA39PN15_9AGAR|nr:golgi reassembly stacking protein 2 [Armillaria novae-zelandiae]